MNEALPDLKFDSVNPHFKNEYLSLRGLLDQVLPVLREYGLLLVQTPSHVSDGSGVQPALTTTIVHVPTGEHITDTMLLSAVKQDPQAQGSAITYARRYALSAFLNVAAEADDDGNAASGGESSSTSSGSSGESGRSTSSDSSEPTVPKF